MLYWIRQMETSLTSPQNFALADFELHRIVVDAAHNPFIRALYGVIELAHAFAYQRLVDAPEEDVLLDILGKHKMLVERIEYGDEAGARVACSIRSNTIARSPCAADCADPGSENAPQSSRASFSVRVSARERSRSASI